VSSDSEGKAVVVPSAVAAKANVLANVADVLSKRCEPVLAVVSTGAVAAPSEPAGVVSAVAIGGAIVDAACVAAAVVLECDTPVISPFMVGCVVVLLVAASVLATMVAVAAGVAFPGKPTVVNANAVVAAAVAAVVAGTTAVDDDTASVLRG